MRSDLERNICVAVPEVYLLSDGCAALDLATKTAGPSFAGFRWPRMCARLQRLHKLQKRENVITRVIGSSLILELRGGRFWKVSRRFANCMILESKAEYSTK